jgi:hypothetical protein
MIVVEQIINRGDTTTTTTTVWIRFHFLLLA